MNEMRKLITLMEAEMSQDPVDDVTVDIPLLIRIMEFAREDAQSDADLHVVAENMVDMSNSGTLTMDDYDAIIADANSQEDPENNMNEARGDIRKGLGALAVLAALGLSMPSTQDTPLGKAMQAAADQGDPVATKHLSKLDFYADENPAMLQKLSKRYLK